MLQDAHIHIQDLKNSAFIDDFLNAASAQAIDRFFGCAITPADWPMVESLASRCHGLVPFFGIHPWFADMPTPGWENDLRALLEKYPGAGVGETGLDRTRKNIDMDVQKDIFRRHLVIAREFSRPFALHCVRAWPDTLALIKENAGGLAFCAHSFYGTPEILAEVLSLGGYASFSAKQLLKPDDILKPLVAATPVDRILIETDFPYQTKWTTSADYVSTLRLAYEVAAGIKGLKLQEFTEAVFKTGAVLSKFVPS